MCELFDAVAWDGRTTVLENGLSSLYGLCAYLSLYACVCVCVCMCVCVRACVCSVIGCCMLGVERELCCVYFSV